MYCTNTVTVLGDCSGRGAVAKLEALQEQALGSYSCRTEFFNLGPVTLPPEEEPQTQGSGLGSWSGVDLRDAGHQRREGQRPGPLHRAHDAAGRRRHGARQGRAGRRGSAGGAGPNGGPPGSRPKR